MNFFIHTRQNIANIDIGRPPFASGESTFRFHFHDFENVRCPENPEFRCFGRRWSVEVYPSYPRSWEDPNDRSMIAINLKKFFADSWDDENSVSSSSYTSDDESMDSVVRTSINVNFSFTVKDLDGKVLRERTKRHNFNRDDDDQRITLIERDAVIGSSNHVLQNGTLTIELKMQSLDVKDEHLPSRPFVPANPLTRNMKKLFLDQKTADVLFAVHKQDEDEATKFYAHKLIVQASSGYLGDLCNSYAGLTPIPIARVDPKVFKLILHYMYGGHIATMKWRRHLEEILDAADLFGVASLKLEAEARFVSNTTVTIDNVADLLVFADTKQCAHLKEVVMDFVIENKHDVLQHMTEDVQNVPESGTIFTDLLAAIARRDGKNSGSRHEEESIHTMRVGDLRRKLDEKNLDVDGSREALVTRLKEYSKRAGEKRSRSSQGE